MYGVVLVDDEAIILEGLHRVVPWKEYGCEVIGTAEDAVTGAALIREKKPDILFTDIRMPGQNGLVMLAGLRSEFPGLQVTVLTGYRDFSYAQEAIRLGVTRFLLKPSRMEEITEALSAMTEHLGNTIRTEDQNKEDQNTGSFLVNHAMAYLEKHYAEKLTLQDVADACYVSQWHLSKLLNKNTGKSFYDLLNSVRIDAARRLLRTPGLKIGEVSEMVGYTDTAHFARVFRKITGMSANEYRNGGCTEPCKEKE